MNKKRLPQNLPHDVCCVSEQQISDKLDKWALAVGIPVPNYNDFWSSFEFKVERTAKNSLHSVHLQSTLHSLLFGERIK